MSDSDSSFVIEYTSGTPSGSSGIEIVPTNPGLLEGVPAIPIPATFAPRPAPSPAKVSGPKSLEEATRLAIASEFDRLHYEHMVFRDTPRDERACDRCGIKNELRWRRSKFNPSVSLCPTCGVSDHYSYDTKRVHPSMTRPLVNDFEPSKKELCIYITRSLTVTDPAHQFCRSCKAADKTTLYGVWFRVAESWYCLGCVYMQILGERRRFAGQKGKLHARSIPMRPDGPSVCSVLYDRTSTEKITSVNTLKNPQQSKKRPPQEQPAEEDSPKKKIKLGLRETLCAQLAELDKARNVLVLRIEALDKLEA